MPYRKHLDEIDLHLAWILFIVLPIALFWLPFPWAALPVGLVPQGPILTHFADVRRDGHHDRAWAYLLVNECFVLLLTLLAAAASGL